MLKPSVRMQTVAGVPVADFWDCLRLDPAPVNELKQWLDRHLASGGQPDLVIDLAGVDFAGSAALGSFVALQRVCREAGGTFLFCRVEPSVRDVFRLSRLEPLFRFAPDVDDAVSLVQALRHQTDSETPEGLSDLSRSHAALAQVPPVACRRRADP